MSIYSDATKEGTFLWHYMRWNSQLETPDAYDFWCGMWLLSSAIGRAIHIPRPGAPVYLNLYVVLCADAGVTRKSTAIGRAMAVYSAVELEKKRKTVTGTITSESFLHTLALRTMDTGNAEASLVASELVRLLGKENYASNMPGLLTDLYDCPDYRSNERTGSRVYNLRNVHITFIGASTAAWLTRAINPDVIEGGFTSRCLFIVDEKRKRRVAWPTGTLNDVPEDVTQRLQHAANQAVRFAARGLVLNDLAIETFTKWYNTRDDKSDDPFIASFEAREDHHILRLAGLLAANDDCWVVEARHINYAIRIIEHHKKTAAYLFGAQKANLRLVAGLDKLRTVLMEGGTLGLTQTELVFKVRAYLQSRELTFALQLMHELEMVQRFEIATAGRTKTIWRATNRIAIRANNEVLKERFLT